MIKTLQNLCIESFFTCKKTKLSSSYYCLFSYINILMNQREIYFLCENTSDDICLNYPKKFTYCKHCKRLEIYNKLFQKIENERKRKTFKLISFVDQITDFVLKFKKCYILPELSDKYCNLYHFRSIENRKIKCRHIEESH